MATSVRELLRLWYNPADAMSALLDRGSLLFSSLSVLAVSLLLTHGLRISFYTPLLILAAVYVPGTLLIANLLARLGGLGVIFQRDYSPLLTCASMAWASANLPLVIAAWAAPPPQIMLAVVAGAYVYFLFLMFLAVRTVFGTANGIAVGVVALSWIPLVALVFVWGPLRFLLGWVASPFFLFYAYYYLGGEFSHLGDGLRRQQSFRRMLEAAAINPHDGEAQYQLGLICQERRRYTDAIQRFQKAVAIDPTETDAHFQLGRIARAQGRYDEALKRFQTVLAQNEKHSSSEIHRELGATYLALQKYPEARHELELYVDRREYDPEGLYHYGEVLEALGDSSAARDAYTRAIEAGRTAPRYRRRFTAPWSRLASRQLRHLKP